MRIDFRPLGFGLRILFCSLGLMMAAGPDASAAELQGYAWFCAETKQMCWWHKAIVDPPKGWAEDKAWTKRYQAVVMFPDGKNDRSKPVMYVRTHNGDKNLSLEEYISVAQERWKTKVTDSIIEPLPDFTREAKPSLKVYLYKNPSQQDQEFELTAFMKDVDVKHPEQTYFFQIVMSSSSIEEIEKAKPAFFDVLKRL